MALSMDEQRILDEIERGLASADPALATRMATFGAPRRIAALRMRRLRLVASLMTLVVVAMVSVLVYALAPFRDSGARPAPARTAAHGVTRQVAPAGQRSTAGMTGSRTP